MEEEIIKKNINMIKGIATEFSKKHNLDFDDLFQEGCIGMIEGIRKFEEHKQAKLNTFCYICIKNRIRQYVKDNKYAIRLPAYIFTENKVEENLIDVVSYENILPGTEEVRIFETLKDENAQLPFDENLDLDIELKMIISKLKKREKEVIYYRFYKDLTLQEVGKIYKITKERVRQIEKEALTKIREKIKRGGI